MKKTFMIFIVALIFILSGCEEDRIIDITGNEDLVVYIGSSEETIVSYVSVSGSDSNQNYDISVDLSKVRINIPGTYDIVYIVSQNGTVVYRETSTITITDTPLTDYPEINFTQDLVHVISHPIPDYASTIEAVDRQYGTITNQVQIDDSSVNYNQVGSYDVVYSVTNSDQLTTTKTIQVHVVANTQFSPLPEEFFIVEKNGKFGIKSTSNTTIIPFTFDYIVYLNESIVKLIIDDVSYYYNFDSQTYFTPGYDIYVYSGGIAKAKDVIGYYGYVDIEGNIEIPFIYDTATSFTRGLAKISEDGLYGLIDTENRIVLPIQYNNINVFNDGYIVSSNDKVSVLSDSGNTLFEADAFDPRPIILNNQRFYEFTLDNKLGLVDENFQVLKEPIYEDIENLGNMLVLKTFNNRYDLYNVLTGNQVSNIYSYQVQNQFIIYQTETGNGVLDLLSLEEIIPPNYISISLLDQNLFLVRNQDYDYGLMNNQGTEILEAKYSQFRTLQNGLYVASDTQGSRLLDETGSIISNTYDSISSFNEGYAIVGRNGLYGLIVEDGTEVLRLTYNQIRPVQNGYIHTYTSDVPNQSAWGVLNLNMQIVIPNIYASIGPLQDGVFAVTKDYSDETSSGYINEQGAIVLSLNYKETTSLIDGYGVVTHEDNSKQVINNQGDFIHDSTYHNIEELRQGYFIVQSSDSLNSHCLMDTSGQIVTPCIYQYITPFIDGVATITTNEGSNYLTIDGDILLDDYANYVNEFSNGMGLLLNNDYKTDIINVDGDYLFQDLFSAKILSEDYVAIKDIATLKYGIYNVSGDMVIDHTYFTIEAFNQGFSLACINSHTSCGVLDDDLNIRVPFMYDLIEQDDLSYILRYKGIYYSLETSDFKLYKTSITNTPVTYVYNGKNDLYIDDIYIGTYTYLDFIKNGMYFDVYGDYLGLSSLSGKILIPPIYEGYTYQANRPYQLIMTNGLYGVIDNENNIIISELYNIISPVSEEYLLAVQGDLHGIFDIEGHMIIPVNYDQIIFETK